MSDKKDIQNLIDDSLYEQMLDIYEKSTFVMEATMQMPDGSVEVRTVRPLLTPDIIRLTVDIKKALTPKETKKGGGGFEL